MYNMGASLLGAAILSGWFKGKPKVVSVHMCTLHPIPTFFQGMVTGKQVFGAGGICITWAHLFLGLPFCQVGLKGNQKLCLYTCAHCTQYPLFFRVW